MLEYENRMPDRSAKVLESRSGIIMENINTIGKFVYELFEKIYMH